MGWTGLGGVPEPALGGAEVLAAVEADDAVEGHGGRAIVRFSGGGGRVDGLCAPVSDREA